QKCQILKIPIAHSDGNYNCDESTLSELEKNSQVIFRYTTPDGKDDAAGNPNGTVHNIAGVCNRERNVAGLMPHPERAVESALGSADGLVIFRSMVEALVGAAKATARNVAFAVSVRCCKSETWPPLAPKFELLPKSPPNMA